MVLKWEESIVRCRILTLMTMGVVFSLAWSAEKDTPAAAATRKKLQTKISVEYKDVSLKEITDDIKQKVNDASGTDLSIYLDGPGGVSGNSTLSYSAKDKTRARNEAIPKRKIQAKNPPRKKRSRRRHPTKSRRPSRPLKNPRPTNPRTMRTSLSGRPAAN